MTNIIIFTSELHNKDSVLSCREKLFDYLKKQDEINLIRYEDIKNGFATISNNNSNDKTLCFVATGGTEYKFKDIASTLPQPIHIISDGYHNSLAASFEICTWMTQHSYEFTHTNFPLDFTKEDILPINLKVEYKNADELYADSRVKCRLSHERIGLFGHESEWLISSELDKKYLENRHKVKFIDISLDDVIEEFNKIFKVNTSNKIVGSKEIHKIDINSYNLNFPENRRNEIIKALCLYEAINVFVEKNKLTSLSIKCFDLLDPTHTTACLALALLNDRGIISSCEGDLMSLWSMIISDTLFGNPGFQANPSSSSIKDLTIDFAHCTIPFSMIDSYSLPTHYESGLGVGIKGILPKGEYSIFKIGNPRLDKYIKIGGTVLLNTEVKERCRSQIRFAFSNISDYNTFFSKQLGNHIIITKS
ncbi:MAG: hypothetical protein WC140_01770 [Bacteroidales bacterium]